MNPNSSKGRFRSKLYFLDRNIIIAIKRYNELIRRRRDKIPENDMKIILSLKSKDKKKNMFTPLLSIMEGTSGKEEDTEKIKTNIEKEFHELAKFFKKSYIESSLIKSNTREKFLKAITSIGHRHQICCWIQFLKETNFYLSKNICQDRKLYITNEILEIAKKYDIDKKHPIVIAALAKLYGDNTGQKILKFKQKAERKNFYNSVMDINCLWRFLRLTGKNNISQYKYKLQFKFITGDKGLDIFFNYFDFLETRVEGNDFDAKLYFSLSQYGKNNLPKELIEFYEKLI